VAGSLGFIGTPACCRAPCPAFPLHKVVICIALNDSTSVRIQQGCATVSPLLDIEGDCNVDWSWGQTYTSDGRKCVTVNWNRTVTDGSFVRLRFCNDDPCETCVDADYNSCGQLVANQLLKFEVDGVNYVSQLKAIAAAGSAVEGCYAVRCISGLSGSCCDPEVPISLNNIKAGVEVIFGPIGTSTPIPLVVG
jgi:hypothetical protein